MLYEVITNLAKGVGDTAQVYEIVAPDRKSAVFGVALNSAEYGEGWWVAKIGTDNIAALPWEIYVVDKRAYMAATRAIGAAWRELVGPWYPAMTLVEVRDLLEEGALVEIEASYNFV